FPLVNRTAGALYGRIGGSVFLIGKSTTLLAPDAGPLEVALNVCDGCAVQGQFMLGVHTQLNSAFALATDPPITDNTIVETVTASVAPMGGFADSGLRVARGEKIFIDASGSLMVSGLLPGTYGANGAEGWLGGTPYVIPSSDAYRLHA